MPEKKPEPKGWFQVPGIRPRGDRTLEEQMLGLETALAETGGKTVLDLGCAEGLIGREFARAGAADVLGIELLESHLEIARQACADFSQMRFLCVHLGGWIEEHPEPEKFDIVLVLGIIHKLIDPEVPLRWAARSCRDLLLFRGPGSWRLKSWNGLIHAKHGHRACHVPGVLTGEGFVLERRVDGVRGEGVHYWRRRR